MSDPASISADAAPPEPNRRDFLTIATVALGGVGVGATLYALLDQMSPDASTLAAGGPHDIDVSKLQPGQQVVMRWRDRPVFIVSRTPEILRTLQDPRLTQQLADPQSQQYQQPPYAENWHRSLKPEYGVFVGICTHLGCIPAFDPQPDPAYPAPNWLGGYFCPCHGSKYDLAGRVFRNVPAPYNLPVPPHTFLNNATLRIGENPSGVDFSLESVVQI